MISFLMGISSRQSEAATCTAAAAAAAAEEEFAVSSLSALLLPQSWLLLATGAIVGALVTLMLTVIYLSTRSIALMYAQDRRRRLPKTIIITRHGESEANADQNMWKTIPDNLLGLTEKGKEQASEVGKRAERVLQQDRCCRVHLVVSPFERTLQTAASMRPAFEHRIVRTEIESRIREQEVGNLQDDEFQEYRQEQQKVGRFWYRFPTGESGSDVFDRVKSWWFESVLTVNSRVGFEPIDAMVVVTHGLTMRFILMQLFSWSPTTFHSVWNAGNCGMYVLRKDLDKPGLSPYVLDRDRGDVPRSSIDVMVKLKDNGSAAAVPPKIFKLENYLNIPPPRTTHIHLVKHLLAQQYPNEIPKAHDIASIVFMPFVDRKGQITGRSTSGVASTRPSFSSSSSDIMEEADTRLSDCSETGAATSSVSIKRGESTLTISSTIEEEEEEGKTSDNAKKDNDNNVKNTISDDEDKADDASSDSSYHGDMPIRLARQEESRRWSYIRIPGLTDRNHD